MRKTLSPLIQQTAWLQNISTFVAAKDACVKQALEQVPPPDSVKLENAKALVLEQVCFDVLADPTIATIINKKTYEAFETKLDEFEKELSESAEDWLEKCEKTVLAQTLSCFNRQWAEKIENVFARWSRLSGNRHYQNQKELFLMRAKNNSEKIKRSIASQRND